MIVRVPITSRVNIRMGTHFGLSLSESGAGGVYRDDADTSPARVMPPVDGEEGDAGDWPGRVPLGVVRPPVLRLGGATRIGV